MTQRSSKVICPSCGAENLPGTLFCVQCGTYLPSGGPLRTEPLPEQEEGRPARPRAEGGAEGGVSPALSIEVEMLASGRKVLLSADREILAGRLDAAHGIFPELDLTTDGGLEQGVSRRHARIYMRDGTCFVEDLDSTNGTFLNGERLTPYLPYAFRDGDALMLGTMAMKIRIYSNG
ncbi:MAG: FHA domain-containing protein [Anaerolineae bacterium]|nr:FHA domain-containing protein [Anaerolineae bacterium]